MTKRKVFISHYKGDKVEVDKFISDFSNVLIPKVLGANNNDDFIESTDTDYVMRRIRELYLRDSTVTIVLVGSCTHSRRYIDWEIKSSLRRGSYTPNGLIGIILPSKGESAYLPPRLKDNWTKEDIDCYAKYYTYPQSSLSLSKWIEDVHSARIARADLIDNSRDMMKRNQKCKTHDIVH